MVNNNNCICGHTKGFHTRTFDGRCTADCKCKKFKPRIDDLFHAELPPLKEPQNHSQKDWQKKSSFAENVLGCKLIKAGTPNGLNPHPFDILIKFKRNLEIIR